MSNHYANFGMETKTNTNVYTFVADNDRRKQRISMLVAELAKPSNAALAAKTYGLTYWQDLQSRHTAAWEESKTLKSDKATLSRETKAYFDSVNETLRKLHAQIKIDFPKADFKKVIREFGFLSEVYQ